MIRKRNLLTVSLIVAVMLLTQITVPAQRRRRGGGGGEGGPSAGRYEGVTYSGAFTISNNTGNTLYYQVRWGNTQWQNVTLGSGRALMHYHPLDYNGRAPQPYIRFDRVADGGRYTEQVYTMQFYAVRNGNYGDASKPYEFRYSRGGRFLDLYAIG